MGLIQIFVIVVLMILCTAGIIDLVSGIALGVGSIAFFRVLTEVLLHLDLDLFLILQLSSQIAWFKTRVSSLLDCQFFLVLLG